MDPVQLIPLLNAAIAASVALTTADILAGDDTQLDAAVRAGVQGPVVTRPRRSAPRFSLAPGPVLP